MKRLIVLAVGFAVSWVTGCIPIFDAAAGTEGGVLILSKNPQLSKIPDWPKPTGVGEPDDCNKEGMKQSLEIMRKLGQTAYRCLVVGGAFGGQPWESGAGGAGLYQLQLHPNSPTVWRVFKRDDNRLIALIAEFDATGKLQFRQSARSPDKLLATAQAESTPQSARQQQPRGRNKLQQCDRTPRYAKYSDAEILKFHAAVVASDECKIARSGSFSIEQQTCSRNLWRTNHEVIARGLAAKADGSFCKNAPARSGVSGQTGTAEPMTPSETQNILGRTGSPGAPPAPAQQPQAAPTLPDLSKSVQELGNAIRDIFTRRQPTPDVAAEPNSSTQPAATELLDRIVNLEKQLSALPPTAVRTRALLEAASARQAMAEGDTETAKQHYETGREYQELALNIQTDIAKWQMFLTVQKTLPIKDLPRYGWWGGKGWSGGSQSRAPINSMDALFRQHDEDYATAADYLPRILAADKALVRSLEAVDIGTFTTEQLYRDANLDERYRVRALAAFRAKVLYSSVRLNLDTALPGSHGPNDPK